MTTTPVNPVVEILVNGVWVDIAADVRLASAASGGDIKIKRGRGNEAPAAEPTEVEITLNNGPSKVASTLGQTRVYSPFNPSSPYYGMLTRNVPIRIGVGRVDDEFNRTLVNSWGSTPNWTDTTNTVRAGYAWNLVGTAANFDVTSPNATIQAATGYQSATFGAYGDVDVRAKVRVSNRTSEFGIVVRQESSAKYYTAYVTPGGTDQLRIGRVSSTTLAVSVNMPFNVVAGTDYWMRAQISGYRIRAKIWAGALSDEPKAWMRTYVDDSRPSRTPIAQSGAVGLFAKDGTALVTWAEIHVDQWRAHAEILQMPTRHDLGRYDRWIPVDAKGIRRRLGQGRKNLQSAVTRHLSSYERSGIWLPLEGGLVDNRVPNAATIDRIQPGLASGISFQTPDLTGELKLPGVEQYAHLDEDSSFIQSVAPYDGVTGAYTMLCFFRIPATPASEILLFTYTVTGTANRYLLYLNSLNSVRMEVRNAAGAVLSTDTELLWDFGGQPIGCWIACTLYVFQNGGNVSWAWNYHRPGFGLPFFTMNGSFAGTVGRFWSWRAHHSAVANAAGGLSVAQAFHYPGDLPFVDSEFALAASAYEGESSVTRFNRLCNEVGIKNSQYNPVGGVEMGPQLPSKLLDLLDECAEVEHGALMEDRDDFGLSLIARPMFYCQAGVPLDIDAGHLTSPLDPTPDDQGTRNDVTVRHRSGFFSRSVQETGVMNIQNPEDDPDGIGLYDEAPEINLNLIEDLSPAANWRRSRGTIDDPRYPSLTADLTATAYQASPALAAIAASIDTGRMIVLTNPEVTPDPKTILVQSYTESLGQFDWDITWVGTPGRVEAEIGTMEYTTRVSPSAAVTQAAFTSGTHTSLMSTGTLWVPTSVDAAVSNFDILVAGVRLHVVSIAGASSPQTITVSLTPVNGVVKAIPVGSKIELYQPWRIGW